LQSFDRSVHDGIRAVHIYKITDRRTEHNLLSESVKTDRVLAFNACGCDDRVLVIEAKRVISEFGCVFGKFNQSPEPPFVPTMKSNNLSRCFADGS
jgi:hypothetical protein